MVCLFGFSGIFIIVTYMPILSEENDREMLLIIETYPLNCVFP